MRINVINPKYLTDQHLIAEYREMKMITYYYVKSSKVEGGIDKTRISPTYTLSTGHAYMWYDKMGYIDSRFKSICTEMRERGFQCVFDALNFSNVPKEAFGQYTPTQEDIRINLDRVLIRLAKQPWWYKYRGKEIKNWNKFYEELYIKKSLL